MASLFTGANAPDLTKVEGYPLPVNKGGTGADLSSNSPTTPGDWDDTSLIVGKSLYSGVCYTQTVGNLKNHILAGVSTGSSPTAHTLTSSSTDAEVSAMLIKLCTAKIRQPYAPIGITIMQQGGSQYSMSVLGANYLFQRYAFYSFLTANDRTFSHFEYSGQNGTWSVTSYDFDGNEILEDNALSRFKRNCTMYFPDVEPF